MVAPISWRECTVVFLAGSFAAVGAWLFWNDALRTEREGSLVAEADQWLHQPLPQALPLLPRELLEAALEEGVDPVLVAAIVEVESGYRHGARSPRGAVGLMQVLPETASLMGVAEYSDPRENLRAGCRYLRWLSEDFGTDVDLVLAAYNAGPGAVYRYGGVPPFRETQLFVKRVREVYFRLAGKAPTGITAPF